MLLHGLRNQTFFAIIISTAIIVVITFKSMEYSIMKYDQVIHDLTYTKKEEYANNDLVPNPSSYKMKYDQVIHDLTYTKKEEYANNDLVPNPSSYKMLILTFGGMELTISLDNLNNINNVIYWHEPMKIWERINKNWSANDLKLHNQDPLMEFFVDNHSSTEYESTSHFYEELLSCNFSLKFEAFLLRAVKVCPEYLMMSKVVSDLLKCYKVGERFICAHTENIVERLNQLCKQRKFHVVIKENEENIHSLRSVHRGLNEHLKRSLDILHLVRDPRAVLYGFAKHGRVSTNVYRDDFQKQAQFVCRRLSEDLRFGRENLSILKRYIIQYYENVADNFETKIFRDILNIDSYFENDTSRLVNIDETTVNINWWRSEIPQEFSAAVETTCWKSIMDLGYIELGYDLVKLRENSSLLDK